MTATIKRADTLESLQRCLPLLQELRPAYAGRETDMLAQIALQQQEGFELYYVEQGTQIAACAGIRFLQLLAHEGKILYVDDLITDESLRSKGYGKLLMDYLVDYAKKQACTAITLDSSVQRFRTHRFYLREQFDIMGHHFVQELH